MDCLVKDPMERFQSAAEIRRKLRIISEVTGAIETQLASRKKLMFVNLHNSARTLLSFRRWRWSTIAIISLMSVILILLSIQQIFKREEIDLSKYKFTPIATDAEPEGNAVWSPDGKSIAYLKEVDGYFQIFIRNLENPLPVQITSLEGNHATRPFWSPDGNQIFFITDTCLYSIGLVGGKPKKIIGSLDAATISPNSKYLLIGVTKR